MTFFPFFSWLDFFFVFCFQEKKEKEKEKERKRKANEIQTPKFSKIPERVWHVASLLGLFLFFSFFPHFSFSFSRNAFAIVPRKSRPLFNKFEWFFLALNDCNFNFLFLKIKNYENNFLLVNFIFWKVTFWPNEMIPGIEKNDWNYISI